MRTASVQTAQQRDAEDELAPFLAHFYRQPEHIYLDGNSLGLLSREAEASLLRALDAWKTRAIEAWTEGDSPWFFLAETLAARLAPLVGAAPDEVIVANSTTVNLHQLLATLFRPDAKRNRILTDSTGFPSDLYALQSYLRGHGLPPETHLRLVRSGDGYTLYEDDILGA